MDLKLFLRTMLRRWPILVAVVALAAAGTFTVAQRVGVTYETAGSTLVFPPADSDGPGPSVPGGNPYLELGGLTQARDIVIRTLTSKTVRTSLEEAYPGMSYEAAPDFTNSAPIILFTVEAASRRDSTQALRELMGRVPATLADLQEGEALSDNARITSIDLTEDLDPNTLHKAQIRAGILVAAGILGAGLLLIALVDGILAGRRRRRQALLGAADEREVREQPEASTTDPSVAARAETPGRTVVADAAARGARPEETTFVRPTRLVSVREHRRAIDAEAGRRTGRGTR